MPSISITECIQFIADSTRVVFSILGFILKIVAPFGSLYLIYLTFARKISFIELWDDFWDFIKPTAEKILIIFVSICIFTAIGSYIDPLFGTTVEFSGGFGVIGAVVGVGFWFII